MGKARLSGQYTFHEPHTPLSTVTNHASCTAPSIWLTFQTFGLISVFMFLFLSIYFGSYYRQIPRAAQFNVQVLDLDSVASPGGSTRPAILGPAINNAILDAYKTEPHLGWFQSSDETLATMRIQDGGRGLDPYEYAVERVNNQDVWAVMIVNANATSGAWNSILNGAEWNRMSHPSLRSTILLDHKVLTYSHGSDHIRIRRSEEFLRSRTIRLAIIDPIDADRNFSCCYDAGRGGLGPGQRCRGLEFGPGR